MGEWYDAGSEELWGHIARLLNTTKYWDSCDKDFCGKDFFSMERRDFCLFFEAIGINSIKHRMKVLKWYDECKKYRTIIAGQEKMSMDNTIFISHDPVNEETAQEDSKSGIVQKVRSTLLETKVLQEKCSTLEGQGKTRDPVNQETSREDSESTRVRKRFYPKSEDIFNVKYKSYGRSLLAHHHKAALEAHKLNFRIVRTWFFNAVTKEGNEYLCSDFKGNHENKELRQQYIRSRIKELLPLRFVCPETRAEHEMSWPEEFVFEVVKNMRHEWNKKKRKQKMTPLPLKKTKLGGGSGEN